ncbi:nuclear RNA export factor 2-like isoform X1 [Pieris napi]|uniref:nuclear RNA export factor 2-like isoform X1 n=1 Tax=Pieris napi TaxID=78633 RepID=UPI001FB8FCE3|nr:nuclear RNA export factor 2-like isoform X1 [Pieris napi]
MAEIKFKKFLLNRVTISTSVIDYLETCLSTDDDVCKYSFHKIMLHNWTDDEVNLYEAISGFFSVTFIPVNFVTQNGITTFYTSSLSFVLKIIKVDFLFPYVRNMCSIDILLNDKSSMELFDYQVSLEDIVRNVVNSRFGINFELNLSNFCNDKEFVDKKIDFYKLSLLSQFKILMLRIGKETKYLNLSHNNLSQVPLEILNFFIKGDLVGVDLSYNQIPSLEELQRVSSKIEKLWVEGNPLCTELDVSSYIRKISMKFPRLTELDGIKINNHGIMMPFFKTFIRTIKLKTNMVVEKFVCLYFSHYDSNLRSNLANFYDEAALFTINCHFPGSEIVHSKGTYIEGRENIVSMLSSLPPTVHDRSTFTVDVLGHSRKNLNLVIEGVYKEKLADYERIMFFRRTFMINIHTEGTTATHFIHREIFTYTFATKEMADNSFKTPVRNENQLTLIDPEPEEREVVCRVFTHYTQLKRDEVERRLKQHDWDIHAALKEFCDDYRLASIPPDMFRGEDDLSEVSMDSDAES